MKSSNRIRATILLCATAAVPAWAQSMKPGLWETTSKFESGNGEMANAMAQMQKQMASMSPQQREAMAQMMSKHAGVTMPTMSADGGMVTKVCLTKEMVDNKQLLIQQHGNCTQKNSPIVGGAMTMTFTCTNPAASGEAHFAFKGDTNYSMTMHSSGTVNGKQETMSVDTTGKWLGADCGGIKPLAMPAAK